MARYPKQTLQKIQVRLFTEYEVRTVKALSTKYFEGNESALLRFLVRAAGEVFGVVEDPKQEQEAELASEEAT